jgi:hypothetical protein
MSNHRKCKAEGCNYIAGVGASIKYCHGHWNERINRNLEAIKEEYKQKP